MVRTLKEREPQMDAIHQKALAVAARFKRAEADLISVLQEVQAARVYVKLGYTSLFNYCVQALGLSESVAANFITVARKAHEIPVLQSAIQSGLLSVSKARKITPVLTLANQEEWVAKAQRLPSRELEAAVARIAPREATPERMRFITEERLELRLGISKSLQEKLKRVRDLESQRKGRTVSLEETLEATIEVYLESKDPIKRAERVMKRLAQKKATMTRKNDAPACVTVTHEGLENLDPIPAIRRHQVRLRDGGRCAHVNERGERCENRRWLDIHHIRPRSMGGGNSLENLTTLCSAHHQMEHGVEYRRNHRIITG